MRAYSIGPEARSALSTDLIIRRNESLTETSFSSEKVLTVSSKLLPLTIRARALAAAGRSSAAGAGLDAHRGVDREPAAMVPLRHRPCVLRRAVRPRRSNRRSMRWRACVSTAAMACTSSPVAAWKTTAPAAIVSNTPSMTMEMADKTSLSGRRITQGSLASDANGQKCSVPACMPACPTAGPYTFTFPGPILTVGRRADQQRVGAVVGDEGTHRLLLKTVSVGASLLASCSGVFVVQF